MSLGFGQILIITILIFVIFGAGKLPSVMSDLAKGIRAFKKGMADDDTQPQLSSHSVDVKPDIKAAAESSANEPKV